jgi:alpha-L-fucosidase
MQNGMKIFMVLYLAVAAGHQVRADGWESILAGSASDEPLCLPAPRQLAYQEKQLGAFIHFGLPTYAISDAEYAAVFPWDPATVPDVSRFNPKQLDAEQWILAAKSFGARHVVFPAKHHDGFCLWPTNTTDYSVRKTPWKSGKGDIVREVSDACKKHGLAFGVYCSPADKHYGCYSTRPDFAVPGKRNVVGDRDAYFSYYKQQLTELLSNYGDVVMVWFDNYGDPFGFDVKDAKSGKMIGSGKYGNEIVSLVRKLQPGAVILRDKTAQSDVRPVGGEDGTAPYPIWNMVRKGGVKAYDATLSGTLPPEAEGWYLCESDLPTRPQWIWRPNSDDKLLSVERLMRAYCDSIGRGANILINLTPDPRGLIPEAEVKRLADFGAALHRRFGNPIAQTGSAKGWTSPGVLELILPKPAAIADVVLVEDLSLGQHVLKYVLDAKVGGQWKPVAEGESVGRKHIHPFKPPINNVESLRLRILKADAIPVIQEMSALEYQP